MTEAIQLENPCNFSFGDLYVAAHPTYSSQEEVRHWYSTLLQRSQPEINQIVKDLCSKAGWYWVDVVEGGVCYTSFAPRIKSNGRNSI